VQVGLFVTCLGDTLFPSTGRAVVRLLERLGVEVEFPEEQTCCGQMHLNSGYADEGLALARRLAEVFEGYEAVVTPSASCAGMVREQLGAEAPPVYELSELLVDVLEVEEVGAYYPHRVTYHPTCHSLRTLQLADRPSRLLSRVRGLELVDLPDPLECCGFGGTFAVKNADVSTAMLSDKMRNVLATRAEVLCAVDSSCLMHIGGGLARGRTGVRTVHLAEILASTEDEPWP
jgi:L-lactate dehydrogenase complex protein LldE